VLFKLVQLSIIYFCIFDVGTEVHNILPQQNSFLSTVWYLHMHNTN